MAVKFRKMAAHDFRVLECAEGFCIKDLSDGYIHDALSADPLVFRTKKEAEDWIKANAGEHLTDTPHRC